MKEQFYNSACHTLYPHFILLFGYIYYYYIMDKLSHVILLVYRVLSYCTQSKAYNTIICVLLSVIILIQTLTHITHGPFIIFKRSKYYNPIICLYYDNIILFYD